MDKQSQVQTGPGRSEKSITITLSEDALPVGLMPPTFPPDYVAGSVVPFFLAGSYVGETPSLPMIDLTLSKEGGLPRAVVGYAVRRLDRQTRTKRAPRSSCEATKIAGRTTSARRSI